jgi:hypothetical protein
VSEHRLRRRPPARRLHGAALLVLGLLDLLEPRHRPARALGDPERKRGRIVLLGDTVLLDVAVELGQGESRVVTHS